MWIENFYNCTAIRVYCYFELVGAGVFPLRVRDLSILRQGKRRHFYIFKHFATVGALRLWLLLLATVALLILFVFILETCNEQ